MRLPVTVVFLALAGSALVTPIIGDAQAQATDGGMASLAGATGWLNTAPLSGAALRGKVVLVDFWTYSCINCLREMPYVQAWADKYRPYGLVVVGVHAYEFAFEKNIDNVRRAVKRFKITFPVAIDNDRAIWNGFDNQYWPAAYFVDAQGNIRDHHFGEGSYARSERTIQRLLTEAGAKNLPTDLVRVNGSGEQSEGDPENTGSPETYIGYDRAQNFISTGGAVQDVASDYVMEHQPSLNEWGLTGNWTIGEERATLHSRGGRIVFRFHARDLHLVLGPSRDGKPVRFRVTIDGRAPGMQHGTDTDENGNGTVTVQRLYQLVRQTGPVTDHTFQIEFLDTDVEAFSFTFG